MKQDGDFGVPVVGARPARRGFGFGERWGRTQDVAVRKADQARERSKFGVSTGVLFFLGLGITTCGILLARSESQFQWFPRDVLAVTSQVLENSQAEPVG